MGKPQNVLYVMSRGLLEIMCIIITPLFFYDPHLQYTNGVTGVEILVVLESQHQNDLLWENLMTADKLLSTCSDH